MARRALLDVNALIAALDATHLHHARVTEWLATAASAGWASCPLTQNGCVRIMSQPAYTAPVQAADVIERLREATLHPSHEFWPDEVSLLDDEVVHGERVLGPKQVTDIYLLALAVRRGGCLVTIDKGVPLNAVPGATPEHLVKL